MRANGDFVTRKIATLTTTGATVAMRGKGCGCGAPTGAGTAIRSLLPTGASTVAVHTARVVRERRGARAVDNRLGYPTMKNWSPMSTLVPRGRR